MYRKWSIPSLTSSNITKYQALLVERSTFHSHFDVRKTVPDSRGGPLNLCRVSAHDQERTRMRWRTVQGKWHVQEGGISGREEEYFGQSPFCFPNKFNLPNIQIGNDDGSRVQTSNSSVCMQLAIQKIMGQLLTKSDLYFSVPGSLNWRLVVEVR